MKLPLEWYLTQSCCKLQNVVKSSLLCYCCCLVFCQCYFLHFFKLWFRSKKPNIYKYILGHQGYVMMRHFWLLQEKALSDIGVCVLEYRLSWAYILPISLPPNSHFLCFVASLQVIYSPNFSSPKFSLFAYCCISLGQIFNQILFPQIFTFSVVLHFSWVYKHYSPNFSIPNFHFKRYILRQKNSISYFGLDSNWVWYSLLWSERPRNHHNMIWSQMSKGAGSFHIHHKAMKELCAMAVLGIWERPNLTQNFVTHAHW